MTTAFLDAAGPNPSLTRRVVRRAGRGLMGPFGAPLLLSLTAVGLFLLPEAGAVLEYDRAAIFAGDWWRIATGHMVHRSVGHLGWDVFAFALLGGLCALRMPRGTWLALGVATVAIPLVLLAWVPELDTYRGLSGLDSTLYVLAALLLVDEGRRSGHWRELLAPSAALVLFVAKVSYETATGSAWFAPPAAPGEVVVPLAHLIGAAAALVPFAVRRLPRRSA